jgi:N6-adenosine-specific RNA methylase IME4
MPAQYGVIYADPPWSFKTFSEKGLGRSADSWYETLSLDEIKALPVGDLATPDSVLLMWVTDPFLRLGFDVIDAWGFTFKTVGFYWAKCADGFPVGSLLDNIDRDENWPIGTGYWTRANPEQCLLATRGHPKRLNADVRKLIVAERREHSRKPDEVYERIERLCAGPYVELFARQARHGWDTMISNEVDSGPGARRWDSRSGPTRPSSREIGL